MLKAASLGRFDMVKKMVEAGVDPRHTDPQGNTPRDKAFLYNKYELTEYLKQKEIEADNGELPLVNWKDPSRIRRSGRYQTYLDF